MGTATVEWAPGWIIKGCARCNRALKRPRNEAALRVFCTDYCEEQYRKERRFTRSSWTLRDAQMGTPLHHIYPDMLTVMETVQRCRPSYATWKWGDE